MVLALYAAGLAFLLLQEMLHKKGKKIGAYTALLSAYCVPLAAAWIGREFSPSFTMTLLVFHFLFYIFSEGLVCFPIRGTVSGKWDTVRAVVQRFFFLLGILCAVPAAYGYAVGDDFLDLCTKGAPIGGILFTGIFVLVRRRKTSAGLESSVARDCSVDREKGKELSVGELIENVLSFSAACFILMCGLRHLALLPYGAGLLLVCAARNLDGKLFRFRGWLSWAGLTIASLFSILPSL